MRNAAALGRIEVKDSDGRPHPLGSLWRRKPVVLVFLRHFGCLFCREQVAQLRGQADALRALGAGVAAVGSGTPEQAAEFAAEYEPPFPVYVDPTLLAYRAAGLRRGILDTLNTGTLAHAIRALRTGARLGLTKGDPWQLGGAFVVEPGGRVAFRQVSRDAGDHADPAKIKKALETLG
jgi:peroxiredoxin